jgi:hypothetical protein
VRELARRVLALEADDRFAQACSSAAEPPLSAAAVGYLAAALESGVIAMPRAVSGYSAALERVADTQSKLRWLSIAALALGGLSLALSVGRSGLRATARADAIRVDAGQDRSARRRARRRALMTLVLSVMSLMLVFVVLGAYVVARSSP